MMGASNNVRGSAERLWPSSFVIQGQFNSRMLFVLEPSGDRRCCVSSWGHPVKPHFFTPFVRCGATLRNFCIFRVNLTPIGTKRNETKNRKIQAARNSESRNKNWSLFSILIFLFEVHCHGTHSLKLRQLLNYPNGPYKAHV